MTNPTPPSEEKEDQELSLCCKKPIAITTTMSGSPWVCTGCWKTVVRTISPPTPPSRQGDWEEKLDSIRDSYILLEKKGHLEIGQISDTINWDEIKEVTKKALLSNNQRLLTSIEEMQSDSMWENTDGWNAAKSAVKALIEKQV